MPCRDETTECSSPSCRAREKSSASAGALVIGLEQRDGGYYMPLFITLEPGCQLTEELKNKINGTIRRLTSARHVPDDIIAVPAIPVTHALKKIEVPVKKLFTGHSPDAAINRGSLANPGAVDWFIDRARLYLSETQ